MTLVDVAPRMHTTDRPAPKPVTDGVPAAHAYELAVGNVVKPVTIVQLASAVAVAAVTAEPSLQLRAAAGTAAGTRHSVFPATTTA